jgi:hypothetical protein
MANDVIQTIEGLCNANDEKIFQLFLARIRAWQDFMRRSGDGVLSTEAEVGLFGELIFLQDLIAIGLPAISAIEAWHGPLDGVQDFYFGSGAIEVKSSVSQSRFPANIGSLDQLDDSLIRPLFLSGIRLELSPKGITLPEQISILREIVRPTPFALIHLDNLMLHAGFSETDAEHYTRSFLPTEKKLLQISNDFPRLTKANVPVEIRKVRYEIDLDLITHTNLKIEDVLTKLGVIS